ncbi:hypothetical protein OG216_19365 [Streptomycetaceae bacterium NBC_01309]
MTDKAQPANAASSADLNGDPTESVMDRRLRALRNDVVHGRRRSEDPALAMALMLRVQINDLRRTAAQQLERAEELRAAAQDMLTQADNLASVLDELDTAVSDEPVGWATTGLLLQYYGHAATDSEAKPLIGESTLSPEELFSEFGSSRLVVLSACSTGQGPWTARKVHSLLLERGWTSKSDRPENVVGNVLNKLTKDGTFKRIGRGVYEMTPKGMKLAARLNSPLTLTLSNGAGKTLAAGYVAAALASQHGPESPARDLTPGLAPEEGATVRAEEVSAT